MEQIKASNYKQVEESFRSHKILDHLHKIPENIREDEKKHFHLIYINFNHKYGESTTTADIAIHHKYEHEFRYLADNNKFGAFTQHMIILHDPTGLKDYHELPADFHKSPEEINMERQAQMFAKAINSGAKTPPQSIDQDALREQIRNEEREKLKAEMLKETSGTQEKTKGVDISEIKTAHPFQIKAFAKENNIDLGEATKRDEMVPIVEKWASEQQTKEGEQ